MGTGRLSQTCPRNHEGRLSDSESDALTIALTMASSYKDRNLLAVIGDEVQF
jgi:hypothetical protein